jgi:energy-coupling factor transport system ATP-binding protein
MEAISVKNLLDRNPLKLSGGEQQKVGVTACLAMKCEILLLDEPFSYIEEKSAKELLKILVNLRSQGRTIVLVTHNLKQVIEHADHVALLDKGKCLRAGTPEQVLRSQDSREILMPLLSPKADPVKKGDPQKGTVAWGELARRGVLTQDCIETRADRSQAEPTWDNKKILELRQVEYVYPDGTRGLAGVSLAILAGEILGIVGGNGSGKTTLAKTSVGLLRPSHGELLIAGQNAGRLRPWEIARQVGYVAQLPSEMLFADSVLEECAFGAKCLGIADPIQKARQALELVGLLKYQARHPDSLSHGERRLLTIAAILVNQPQILVLDEPELGLDIKSWESVASTVETLNLMGKTIVLISHNVEILARMCDRIVLMKEGQIMRTSSPGEILSDLGRTELGAWKHSPLFQAL